MVDYSETKQGEVGLIFVFRFSLFVFRFSLFVFSFFVFRFSFFDIRAYDIKTAIYSKLNGDIHVHVSEVKVIL